MRASSLDRIGYFGKIPGRSDFVKLAPDAAAIGMLDDWLAAVMQQLPSDARWKINYDAMSPVSFAFVGPARRHALAGHLVASHDAAGRRFPFLMMHTLDVVDPSAFIARCPFAFAPLWSFLEAAAPQASPAQTPGMPREPERRPRRPAPAARPPCCARRTWYPRTPWLRAPRFPARR